MPDMTTDTHTHLCCFLYFIDRMSCAVKYNGINCEAHLADSSSSAGRNCLCVVCAHVSTCMAFFMLVLNTARAQQDSWGLRFPSNRKQNRVAGVSCFFCSGSELYGLISSRFLKLTLYEH